MAQVTLGLDLGTSGARVLAVDASGQIIAEVIKTHPLYTPQPGWTEQNPLEWWQSSIDALKEVTEQLPEGTEVLALGLSGQMHGMVALDAQGEVIRNALLWNDQRTGKAVEKLNAIIGKETFIARTGNPAITGFQLPKVIWLRDEEPENYRRVRHILLPKDYISFKLTGTMRAEPSDASGTNCFHLASKQWDEEILGALDIPVSYFPEVIASDEVVGKLSEEVAKQVGLPAGIPVVAGAGDNAAAATGLRISQDDIHTGTLSLGSSGVIFAPLTEANPDPQGRVHLFCHADGAYNLLGVTLSAASSLQWLRDTLFPNHSFVQLTEMAAQSQPGSSGVTFKPYLAGERTPHLNPNLRASLSGLSLASNASDIVRSVLEGVAYSLKDALNIIQPLTPLKQVLATGGGSKSDLWVQILADVLEIPVLKPAYVQGAAYGAALLGFKVAGFPLPEREPAVQTTVPQNAEAYREGYGRYVDYAG
ncbi:xylulokinase [Deinococcus roseus]|uniref:Xylulose kinase n=1 Tax=Deinococcus roseus TaxID=392414 RepID=A0ABQ2DDQ3_9DEIO|nr:xylulokinase [Deinococcus roseus]GGJ53896.1 xylulokinase [Deinococcus roseus]